MNHFHDHDIWEKVNISWMGANKPFLWDDFTTWSKYDGKRQIWRLPQKCSMFECNNRVHRCFARKLPETTLNLFIEQPSHCNVWKAMSQTVEKTSWGFKWIINKMKLHWTCSIEQPSHCRLLHCPGNDFLFHNSQSPCYLTTPNFTPTKAIRPQIKSATVNMKWLLHEKNNNKKTRSKSVTQTVTQKVHVT